MGSTEQAERREDEGFTKADFHIHTPESRCYTDALVTAEELVDAALAAGLDAVAITDHNTARGVDRVKEAGERRELAVFPGMELSTGEGHVLALFDRDTPAALLDELLDCVDTPTAARGNGAIPVGDQIEEVFRKISERGGLAIAAHIERWPTGFLQTNEPRSVKKRIHGNPYLSALEITQPQSRPLWNRGEVRGYPRRHACIQGSDAHAPEEIGRRPTYFRLRSLDLNGLRHAFNDFEDSIRFPEDPGHGL